VAFGLYRVGGDSRMPSAGATPAPGARPATLAGRPARAGCWRGGR